MNKAIIDIEEMIRKAAEEGAKKAIRLLNEELRDKRLHNTRLLMKNYNKLWDHIDKVKAEIEFDIEEAADKIWLTSIARTKLRTFKMLAFIDSALEIIKENMRNSCSEYKYKAFEMYYIDEQSNEKIIQTLGCGKNQPKIWSEVVLNELSIYLWGIEGLGI